MWGLFPEVRPLLVSSCEVCFLKSGLFLLWIPYTHAHSADNGRSHKRQSKASKADTLAFENFGGVVSVGCTSKQSAKVFLWKSYFPTIRESFLPRKFPAIRYIANKALGLQTPDMKYNIKYTDCTIHFKPKQHLNSWHPATLYNGHFSHAQLTKHKQYLNYLKRFSANTARVDIRVALFLTVLYLHFAFLTTYVQQGNASSEDTVSLSLIAQLRSIMPIRKVVPGAPELEIPHYKRQNIYSQWCPL